MRITILNELFDGKPFYLKTYSIQYMLRPKWVIRYFHDILGNSTKLIWEALTNPYPNAHPKPNPNPKLGLDRKKFVSLDWGWLFF